jgi:hypothetical protein
MTGHTKCTITKLTEVHNKESTGPASSTSVGYQQLHLSHPKMTVVMVGHHHPQLLHPEVTWYPPHYLMGANSAWRWLPLNLTAVADLLAAVQELRHLQL